jgi:hypothetical protein
MLLLEKSNGSTRYSAEYAKANFSFCSTKAKVFSPPIEQIHAFLYDFYGDCYWLLGSDVATAIYSPSGKRIYSLLTIIKKYNRGNKTITKNLREQ